MNEAWLNTKIYVEESFAEKLGLEPGDHFGLELRNQALRCDLYPKIEECSGVFKLVDLTPWSFSYNDPNDRYPDSDVMDPYSPRRRSPGSYGTT